MQSRGAPGDYDEGDDGEKNFSGVKTLEERNAIGVANAIDVDDDVRMKRVPSSDDPLNLQLVGKPVQRPPGNTKRGSVGWQ